ncbi:ANTAR domain-containing protein [Aeromicrobium sp. CF4.19]|uniref:ANTAR domain-containing protein n=1 Tax=Aeromicrobium sp. CF4.19 TaxID=3373082 RepID=UPI003EE4AFC9
MISPNDLSLARLAAELAETRTFGASVKHIVDFAAETFGTDHAAILLIREEGKTFESSGTSTPVAKAVDALQTSLHEGPCVDAAVESRMVVANDLSEDPRWPRWASAVVDLGIRSVLSTELHAGGRRIGALNIFDLRPREFTREEMELAQLLAYHASAALRAAREIEGLTIALDSRNVIGQAQGILMERYGVDGDRAFAILRRYSQDHNIKLIEVAKGLIRSSDLPTEPSSPPGDSGSPAGD